MSYDQAWVRKAISDQILLGKSIGDAGDHVRVMLSSTTDDQGKLALYSYLVALGTESILEKNIERATKACLPAALMIARRHGYEMIAYGDFQNSNGHKISRIEDLPLTGEDDATIEKTTRDIAAAEKALHDWRQPTKVTA